jgi:hypothetical protein
MRIASLSVLLLLLWTFSAAEVPAAGGAEPASPLPREPAETRCSMKPEPGPCKALFERYFYEEKSKACRPFFWGGCSGAVPFETMAECEQACLSPQTLRMQDLKPLRGEVCMESLIFFPDRPGRKRVTVTATTEGSRVETTRWLGWKPAP